MHAPPHHLPHGVVAAVQLSSVPSTGSGSGIGSAATGAATSEAGVGGVAASLARMSLLGSIPEAGVDTPVDTEDEPALAAADGLSLSTKLWQPVFPVTLSATSMQIPGATASGSRFLPTHAGAAAASGTSASAPGTTGTSAVEEDLVPLGHGVPPRIQDAIHSDGYRSSVRAIASLTRGGALQPRGRVVAIAYQGHPRSVVGVLRSTDDSAPPDAPIPARHANVRLVRTHANSYDCITAIRFACMAAL